MPAFFFYKEIYFDVAIARYSNVDFILCPSLIEGNDFFLNSFFGMNVGVGAAPQGYKRIWFSISD